MSPIKRRKLSDESMKPNTDLTTAIDSTIVGFSDIPPSVPGDVLNGSSNNDRITQPAHSQTFSVRDGSASLHSKSSIKAMERTLGTVGVDEMLTSTPKKGRGRPKGSKNKPKLNGSTPLKTGPGKLLFSTQVKQPGSDHTKTPNLIRNADHSARRKSSKTIIERTIMGEASDDDNDDEEIAQHIYDSEKEHGTGPDSAMADESATAPGTPVTPKRGRGRPKGSKNRKRSLTPPGNLTSHELYFAQNRGGSIKTSNNTLSSLKLLDHEEYFGLAHKYRDPHADDLRFLQHLHENSFTQWQFELSQGFNICVYGWGSKRSLLIKFVEHLYASGSDQDNQIVIVNGYVQSLTIRDILNTVAKSFSQFDRKLGSQPVEMLENLVAYLEEERSLHVTLVINSIDGYALRRPQTQMILSRLSSHPQVSLVASADHPSFPFLWDSSLRLTYNFLFHDCTTFQPHTAEIDVVNEVHELLGRSGRRVGGKEGVGFVLKSLPENARNLFRVLIAEQLVLMDENTEGGFEDQDDMDDDVPQGANPRIADVGVEYRVLYQKAVEEFICSNDMNFRTLLKELVHLYYFTKLQTNVLGFTIIK